MGLFWLSLIVQRRTWQQEGQVTGVPEVEMPACAQLACSPLFSQGPLPMGWAAHVLVGSSPSVNLLWKHRGVSMVNSNPVIEGDVHMEGSLESDLREQKPLLP